MLPTSARVAQEVYEPLIGIQYPMLCGPKNGQWHIGTASIREKGAMATGLRFVNWVHHDHRDETRAEPPPEATVAAYRQIEYWLPAEDEQRDNILVLTTRKTSAQSLQSFFQQSGRRANAETAVKVAGATARHCIVLHGKSNFLSGNSRRTDFDHECYTRANVAYSRATDLTVLACPLTMHGIPGACQVLAALLHGACTLHTSSKEADGAWVEGSFPVDTSGVQASTTAFLTAMEPHPMWNGPLPVCLVEHHRGNPRRLRLVLTWQTLLYPGERLLLTQNPRIHGSGLLFGCAADGKVDPDWLVVPDGVAPHAWRLLHATNKGGTRFTVGHSSRYPPGQAEDVANRAREYHFEALHKIYFYDAWPSQPELNKNDSLLHLPPSPGLLQSGCYWRLEPETPPGASAAASEQDAGVLAEVSLTEEESDAHSGSTQPSLLPSPKSTDHEADSPISVSSTDADGVCSPTEDTERSNEDATVVALTSASEEELTYEDEEEGTQGGGEAEEEEEEEVTDEAEDAEAAESADDVEVVGSDESEAGHKTREGEGEAMQAIYHPFTQSTSSNDTGAGEPPEQMPSQAHLVNSGVKRPAPPTYRTEERGSPVFHPGQTGTSKDSKESEGGYPSSRPSTASASPYRPDRMPAVEGKRRSRWRQVMPESTASPPVGVEPVTTSPSSLP